ncbi:hypothetical protein CO671_02285 [Rhizobium sp. M10]|nr:hypothetical protein CO671_02285 [Rhizobium sp. M10]
MKTTGAGFGAPGIATEKPCMTGALVRHTWLLVFAVFHLHVARLAHRPEKSESLFGSAMHGSVAASSARLKRRAEL